MNLTANENTVLEAMRGGYDESDGDREGWKMIYLDNSIDTTDKSVRATLGSLEQAQTKEQFTRALKRVREVYGEIVNPMISDMTDEQILRINDPGRLSLEDLREYTKRLEAMADE